MDSWDEESLDLSENEAPINEGPKRKLPQQKVSKVKKAKLEPIPGENNIKNKKKSDLLKPPTIEELNNLKTTENLYNNNLFRLQIEELIKEVTIKNKRKKAFNEWQESFKEMLGKLPLSEDMAISNYQCPTIQLDQSLDITFFRPEGFECFGLYENNSLAGPHLETSINLKMPKACFHTKDFLNNRYLAKRFCYLMFINKHLTAHKKTIRFHNNNVLLPILHVQPTEDDKLMVNIYVSPAKGCFKPSRLVPNQNNVKQDLFGAKIQDLDVLKATPTVLYNSTLAHDITLTSNSSFVKTTLSEHNNVQEGIKLISIWLKQRGLDIGYSAFTSEIAMYLVTYLLIKRKLNKFMSSYQVVRNFWSFLGTTDLQLEPIGLGNDITPDTYGMFKNFFDIVFLDVTGCYNLAAFLDANVYMKVKAESELAMQHLDNESNMDSFHSLFLARQPFSLQYDALLDVSKALPLTNQFITTDEEKSRFIGFEQFLSIKHLSDLLKKGLGKRILNIVPHIEVKYATNSKHFVKKVLFGINLNEETAFNAIELGPALNDYARAEEFRNFWSYLSSDRRFRDGSTHVAVYFKASTIRGKRGIVKRIIKYLLMEKLKIDFQLYYDEFEEFLLNKKVVCPYPVGTNEECCLKIITLADELGQKLRSVQTSLSITGIQGVSDAFSYSQVFPPIASEFKPIKNSTDIKRQNVVFANSKKLGMLSRYVEPVELVLQLEHSSKWPNNLQALRHIKTSFYLEIAKMLATNYNIKTNVTKEYLEVFYEGIVFRYKIYIPKEIGLMKRETNEDGSVKYTENIRSVELERSLSVLPKINAQLKGLQLQFPSLGPGTALVKRWLRSHLIDNHHFPDIVIHLMNASLYKRHSVCHTPQISFLRCLKFIAEFQGEWQPLLEDVLEDDVRFGMFNPSVEILGRVQQLAAATVKLAIERMENGQSFDLKALFTPNMDGYDLLIHLKPLLNPRRHEQLDNPGDSKIVLEKYTPHKNEKIPIAGFNPVNSYLNTLRENYSEFATFFHDTYGGNVIGVLWNPKTKDVKDFKVSYVNGRKLDDENKLVLNKEAIIDDFYTLGKGIIKSIELN